MRRRDDGVRAPRDGIDVALAVPSTRPWCPAAPRTWLLEPEGDRQAA